MTVYEEEVDAIKYLYTGGRNTAPATIYSIIYRNTNRYSRLCIPTLLALPLPCRSQQSTVKYGLNPWFDVEYTFVNYRIWQNASTGAVFWYKEK